MIDYTKYEVLKNYALWYYFRYYPSNKKLLSKLILKSQDEKLSQKVFEDIAYLTTEKDICLSKIQNYIFRNKNINYIKSKLISSWFKKEMIIDLLEKYYDINNKSILDKAFLQREIKRLKNKNKSINYIKNKLIEQKLDKEKIDEVVDEIFELKWETENIKKEYEKLKNKYDTKKIIQKLIMKWFKYDDIKKSIY